MKPTGWDFHLARDLAEWLAGTPRKVHEDMFHKGDSHCRAAIEGMICQLQQMLLKHPSHQRKLRELREQREAEALQAACQIAGEQASIGAGKP